MNVLTRIFFRESRAILVFLCLCGLNFTDSVLKAGSQPLPGTIPQNEVSKQPPCNCTVSQGSFTTDLPFFIGNTSATAFYSYGVPLGASSNTGLEISETLLIFLYEDSNTGETSLFIILDQANDGTGGSGTINFNCLPPSAFVVLEDDPGEFTGTNPNIVGNFFWSSCCTDGGVLGGIGCGHSFTINPNIASGINNFALVHGMPGQVEYRYLPEINCPITINCGGQVCCEQAFEVVSSTTDASCAEVSDGSINLSTTCANMPGFIWSTGETTENIDNIPHGNYSVTVTDINGCSERLTFDIDHGPIPEPEITGPNYFCTGDVNPIILNVDGSFDSWLWSTGQNTANIAVNVAGDYSVTVSDENGCTGVDVVTILEHPVPEPQISGPSEICPDGNIIIDVGAGFDSYLWSSGQNTQSMNVISPGVYTVTVTNSFGCTASSSTTIFELSEPDPDINAPLGICGDIPVSLDAGPGYTSYVWSTGEDNQIITVPYPGLYFVTVTNESGCSSYDSVYIDPLPVPQPVIQGLPYLCSGSSVYLDVGSGYFTYSWSNNETTQAVEINTAGIYQITVNNAEGCVGVAEIEITVKEDIVIYLYKTSCNPADTGVYINNFLSQYGCDSLTIETVSYASSDSILIHELTCNLPDAGTFITGGINRYGCDSVHIREVAYVPSDTTHLQFGSCNPIETGTFIESFMNKQGCDSIVIREISLLPKDSIWISQSTCNPQDTGLFIQEYTNRYGCDSLIYSFLYFSIADTTILNQTTCNVLEAGSSQSVLTGQDGCDSLVISIKIWERPDTTKLEIYSCDSTQTGMMEELFKNVRGCDSLVITQIVWLPSDTTLTTSYSCDPGQTGEFIQVHLNQSGCDSVVISRIDLFLADTTRILYETCNSADTGKIVILLFNQAGCDSIVIEETRLLPPAECTLDILVENDTIGCKETLGSLQIHVLNQPGPFLYTWQDQNGATGSGSLIQSAFPGDIPDLLPGMYYITIRNDEGLEGFVTASIIKLQPIQVLTSVQYLYNGQVISCSGARDGSASIQVVQGGKPEYFYIWSSGSQNPQINQVGAGTYYVTVSDAFGCEKIDSVVITEPEPMEFDLQIVQPDCHNDDKGEITLLGVAGGTAPYLYSRNMVLWQDQPVINNLNPGVFIIHIRDANDCLQDTTVMIKAYEYPNINLTKDTVIELGNSILIKPQITPLNRIYSLYWEGIDCEGCHQITVTPSITSEFTIVVIDTGGCEKRASIIVYVKEKENLYFPNILVQKPGGNNYFTIFGSSHLVNIEQLTIYDRWGNTVFNVINMEPNNPNTGWDGSWRGLPVHQGVYVYKAMLVFSDGRKELFIGDITVLK